LYRTNDKHSFTQLSAVADVSAVKGRNHFDQRNHLIVGELKVWFTARYFIRCSNLKPCGNAGLRQHHYERHRIEIGCFQQCFRDTL